MNATATPPYQNWLNLLEQAVRELRGAYEAQDADRLYHWAVQCGSYSRQLASDVNLLGDNPFTSAPPQEQEIK